MNRADLAAEEELASLRALKKKIMEARSLNDELWRHSSSMSDVDVFLRAALDKVRSVMQQGEDDCWWKLTAEDAE
jgi:hypothetical protein